jgi:hypothetical protein
VVLFANLRYFFSQLCDALFDRLLHAIRLAESVGRLQAVSSTLASRDGQWAKSLTAGGGVNCTVALPGSFLQEGAGTGE